MEVGPNCSGRPLKMSAQVWRGGIRKATIWLELRLVVNDKCDKRAFIDMLAAKRPRKLGPAAEWIG